jgi:hypothetical protein
VRVRTAVVLCVASALSGCLNFGKLDDAKIPGELLGTYEVDGTLTTSTCGTGALGSSDHWGFDVKLSRFHEDLYWVNGREVIPGSIAPDGVSFTFTTRVEGEVVPAGRGRAACILSRADSATGRLSSKTLEVETFDASLTFGYSAVEGSNCETWIGSPEGVAALPCSIAYALTGTRLPDD